MTCDTQKRVDAEQELGKRHSYTAHKIHWALTDWLLVGFVQDSNEIQVVENSRECLALTNCMMKCDTACHVHHAHKCVHTYAHAHTL